MPPDPESPAEAGSDAPSTAPTPSPGPPAGTGEQENPPRDPSRHEAPVASDEIAGVQSKQEEAASSGRIYYTCIELLQEEPPSLDYIVAPGAPTPPAAMTAFIDQVEEVARLIRILFHDDKQRRWNLFRMLHKAAWRGLCGADANVQSGANNLELVKKNIEDQYPALRSRIWYWNLWLLFGAASACAVASFITWCNVGSWPWELASVNAGKAWLFALFLIPFGAMAGLFAEFVFRVNDDIPYEQLRAINPGRWKPFQRALNTSIIAFIFAGILSAQIIQVGLANVLLNQFVKGEPLVSLAIGFVTGIAFPYVRDLVQQTRPTRRDQDAGTA